MVSIPVPRKYCLSTLLVLLLSLSIHAQELQINGGFLDDSTHIGKRIPYYLTARYPSNLTVVFPDSVFAFTPFEYAQKKFFPTKTTGSTSFDSAVYYLTTFEVDSIQFLQLPVFIVNPQDCTIVHPERDSVFLEQLVSSVPDSLTADRLPLKTNTSYEPVNILFNYPVLLLVLGILLIAAMVIWIVFGKKIKKHFLLKRLQRAHSKFVEDYTSHLTKLQSAFSIEIAESTLFLWKKYMEQLESRPFTKLTTREMMQLQHDESLGTHLKAVDRVIYGHNTEALRPLEELREYANIKYRAKLDEVKHG